MLNRRADHPKAEFEEPVFARSAFVSRTRLRSSAGWEPRSTCLYEAAIEKTVGLLVGMTAWEILRKPVPLSWGIRKAQLLTLVSVAELAVLPMAVPSAVPTPSVRSEVTEDRREAPSGRSLQCR